MTPETQLASPQPQGLVPADEPRKFDLFRDLAEAVGLDAKSFLAAVKRRSAKCNPTDTDVTIMLILARSYGLDPMSSPPEIQLLDVGNGPEPYARLDAYKKFIRNATAKGVIEVRPIATEGWYPDPRQPEGKATRRGVKVVGKLAGEPGNAETTVWWDEWNTGKGQWAQRGSHMLRGRGFKEWARDHIGYAIYDEDDAQRIQQTRDVTSEAVVTTTPIAPSIPIAGLQRPALPPPAAEPFTIDVPRSEPVEAQGKPTEGGPITAVSQPPSDAATTASSGGETSASPAPSPGFDEAESRRLDAEEAERQKKGELFS